MTRSNSINIPTLDTVVLILTDSSKEQRKKKELFLFAHISMVNIRDKRFLGTHFYIAVIPHKLLIWQAFGE